MAKRVAHPSAVPAPWSQLHTHIDLWHGCLESDARSIETNGIDLKRSRTALDFGRGFYTTTKLEQAEEWAQKKYRNQSRDDQVTNRPTILKFRTPLARLATIECLTFVRGEFKNDLFWSFVDHCRSSTVAIPKTHLNPTRNGPNDWYDMVCGPVAAVWPPDNRVTFPESDQFSFHTSIAIAILNDVIGRGSPDFEIEVQKPI
jgi:hypothetical protein